MLVSLLLPLLEDDFDSIFNCHGDRDKDHDVNISRKWSWISSTSLERRSVKLALNCLNLHVKTFQMSLLDYHANVAL